VEFALVIPIFLTIVVAIAEFAFVLTVKTGVSFAGQDATQLAAELGNTPDADVLILQQIEKDLQAPVNSAKVTSVTVFWTDSTGVAKAADTWTKPGSYSSTILGVTIPYSQGAQNYLWSNRCNILTALGCATGHTTLDWIGVSISYQYSWVTPLPGLVGLGSSAPLFVETHISRMEPVQ
jgi:hypothetical protein